MRYLLLALLLAATAAMMGQDYKAAYKKVDNLSEEGKFRSALEAISEVYDMAAEAGDEDEMLKAIAHRAAYTARLEEDGTDAAIKLLQAELATNKNRPVVTPVLHYMLGQGYYNYARQNSYRLRNATAATDDGTPAADAPLADWTMLQLATTAEEHLLAGLEGARANRTRLAEIPAIVSNLNSRVNERPTLYDLLVLQSMPLLASPLLNVTNPVPANPEKYAVSVRDFVKLSLEDLEEGSGNQRRLALYQDLLDYHLESGGEALLRADLQRVELISSYGLADSTYASVLERMHQQYKGTAGFDLFLLAQARLHDRAKSDWQELPRAHALKLLDQITETSPEVVAAAESLRRSVLSVDLSLNLREVYTRNRNLLVAQNYRNVEKVFYRVVAMTGKETPEDNRYNREPEELLPRLLKLPRLQEKSVTLPANDDYSAHTTEISLEELPSGRYYLIASDNKDFSLEEGTVVISDFQVSDLAIVRLETAEDNYFQIVDRTTGEPKAGVRVVIEQKKGYRDTKWSRLRTKTTGSDGRVAVPRNERGQLRLQLEDAEGKDRFVSETTYSSGSRQESRNRVYPVTTLFTDRAIYRPGQTVRVYGLTMEKNQDNMPRQLTGADRKVTLLDANYQEVESVEVTSDRLGRFDLSFKLPTGGLTGNFNIRTEGGSLNFRVEAYKRPRFQVELEAPDFVVAGEEAEVTGSAKLYAGPGLNDAKVNYRVFVEEIRYYWFYRGGGNSNDRELVASGETSTDGDGAFSLSFTPEEGLSQGRRRYRYVIETDVADDTGETHEASTSVSLRGEKPVVGLSVEDADIDVTDSLIIVAAGTDETLTVSARIVPVTKPGVGLLTRAWGFPDRPVLSPADYQKLFPGLPAEETPADPADWPAKSLPVYDGQLEITEGKARLALDATGWPAGHYRLEWNYPDGTKGEASAFTLMNAERGELPEGQLYALLGKDQVGKVGQAITLTLISAVDIPHIDFGWRSRNLREDGISAATRRTTFTYTPTEDDRGGIGFGMAFYRFGEVKQEQVRFGPGWENKKLQIDYATFRDKLRPGTPERWTLTVKNADGSPVPAAALATMYDASLDQIYAGSGWAFNPWPTFGYYGQMASQLNGGTSWHYGISRRVLPEVPSLQELPGLDLGPLQWGYGMVGGGRRMLRDSGPPVAYSAAAPAMEAEGMAMSDADGSVQRKMSAPASAPPPPPPAPADDEAGGGDAPVQIRKNLQETAFWLPDLRADADGNLVIEFDSPEALTSWKLRVFAHDPDLASAVSEQKIVTQKELMVLPNVPRFVREGDAMELTARVNNMTELGMVVKATLELFDPATGEAYLPERQAALLGGASAGAKYCQSEQRIEAGSGASFCFPLNIPDGLSSDGPIGYRVIVRGGDFSDGEENVIPVLTDRTLITVSQPFYLKRKEKKTITLPLLASSTSASLQHVGYTFEATTNPAWIALKSLPYLMEYPYDCTEQLANRYFANQLAFATVSRKPILEEVFRQWQADPNALKSELERNPQLKNALLTETPWLRAAQSETEQRARIANLFDLKKLADEQVAALEKLANRQDGAGYFSWFPGGRENRYMTQYVVETMGRMQQLGVVTPDQTARVNGISQSAINWLDQEMRRDYDRYLKQTKDKPEQRKDYMPSSSMVHYLYARAMSEGVKVDPSEKVSEALAFYSERIAAKWLSYGLYEQALIASTSVKTQQDATAKLIVESLRERAIRKDEFGMYWKYGQGFRWQNLPIETHCRILEAFQLAGGTTDELDEMRLWLLTNKRTNRWSTTKSTAAAVFALLNTGTNWTDAPGKPLQVEWPNTALKSSLASRVRAAQASPEAATGAFSVSAAAGEIDNGLASVKVKNKDNRLVWGGVYWQYTELAEKVVASNDGPLTLSRELYRRVPTDDGMRLEPITADKPLAAGDRVTVRLILKSDREMDFVHLKDRRAATFEPIEQLSKYQYQNGLGYYQAPGDLATNFFIDHLPRGTFTLEYDLFTTYSGSFSNGLGRVQCMYAPEFGGNTGGARILVE
ncbi:alpha-2-macroglobulin family protein [Neolewinella agarilytica]|uniref:alpha-2-macroglobulin family protein n=1 Tax=Neolewinella agarilytica TaxID=478744 RepID=UPI0023541869|nr:alpha-2-macroglobulin family protein [Neolewinella agarilytica]